MPLTLRPTGLSSPAYADKLDYVVCEDGKVIGRIYEDWHMLPDLRWFWSITVYVDAKREALPGNAPRAWMRLKRNSSRIGSGAAPTRLRPDGALLSCRHVVASACPAGGLCRAVPPHNRPAPTFRRAVAARNQARWVPGHRAQEWPSGEALQPVLA